MRAIILTKRLEAEAKIVEARGRAAERILKALHPIHRSGGSIKTSLPDISGFLYTGSQEFPNDPLTSQGLRP
jgi:hypothetical protein